MCLLLLNNAWYSLYNTLCGNTSVTFGYDFVLRNADLGGQWLVPPKYRERSNKTEDCFIGTHHPINF